MSLRLLVILWIGLCGIGCSPLSLKGGKFEPIGRYGAEPAKGSETTADKVEVFVRSAPEGFMLEKNGLTVLPGYDHQVLGIVRAVPAGGNCELSDVGMKEVVAVLQKEAAGHGGNAVIYVESNLSDPSDEMERCNRKNYGPDKYFGIGWAVIRSANRPPTNGGTNSEISAAGTSP